MDSLNPSPTVELLYAPGAEVAEGPFYEEETNTLLWVDIYKKTINFFSLKNNQNRLRSLNFSETVGAAIPVEGCNQVVALLGRRICLVDRDTGEVVKVLTTVQEDKPGNRFNDGKCDSSGRLWCGTMGAMSAPGVLEHGEGFHYSYESPGPVKEHIVATLSNGLDWNLKDDIMYFIDSVSSRCLYSFSYQRETGTLSNQQPLVDYNQHSDLAMPDGMCRDTQGRLWVCSFGGQCVTCWSPAGEKLMDMKIPGAKCVTSCCFGGPNYEWMFVTTAAYGCSEQELADYPNSGSLFVVKDLGACGTAPHKFKP